jgi:hypothetical protein
VSGPLAGERFPIESEVIVGSAEADITVEDPEISQRHAAIRPVGDLLEITDLGSANGTRVNGVRVDRPTRIGLGDLIELGSISMRFEFLRLAHDLTVIAPAADPGRTVVRPRVERSPPEHPLTPGHRPAVSAHAMYPEAGTSQRPVEAPHEPFGALTTASGPRRSRIATRHLVGIFLTLIAIIAVAAALIVYFAVRS